MICARYRKILTNRLRQTEKMGVRVDSLRRPNRHREEDIKRKKFLGGSNLGGNNEKGILTQEEIIISDDEGGGRKGRCSLARSKTK